MPFPGARWWKVDFHSHSPASFDFGGLEGVPTQSVATYEEWLLAYMKAGIDAVVIADHNTHEGIDLARAALVTLAESGNRDFRKLVLFPGVELTVDGGFHLLGVFDPSVASDVVTASFIGRSIRENGAQVTARPNSRFKRLLN